MKEIINKYKEKINKLDIQDKIYYILKQQELDDNKEYTVSEIKDIFNQAFEGKEVTKEAELDI